jgi:hypothetical protein
VKKARILVSLFSLIPALVKAIEIEFGPSNGQEKKAAAIDALKELAGTALQVGAAAVAANNPIYADAISKAIDVTVTTLNATGQMPTPTPAQ